MRVGAIAIAALLALGLTGCTNPDLSVFDRPQVESDVIANAADLELDPGSTRLLWDGEEAERDEGDDRKARSVYLARQDGEPDTTCLVVASSIAPTVHAMACSPGSHIELSFNSEQYLFVTTDIDGEADGWERLGKGLWRKL
ncbi:MAG: hypothetical protein KF680_07500 [Cryobacterium sp.]|nr:hypothetical protein [Cryobacterium sp.]